MRPSPFLVFVGWTVGRTVGTVLLLLAAGWNIPRLIDPIRTRRWAARYWPLGRGTSTRARPDRATVEQSPARSIWERTNALVWLFMIALFLWTVWLQR